MLWLRPLPEVVIFETEISCMNIRKISMPVTYKNRLLEVKPLNLMKTQVHFSSYFDKIPGLSNKVYIYDANQREPDIPTIWIWTRNASLDYFERQYEYNLKMSSQDTVLKMPANFLIFSKPTGKWPMGLGDA